MLDLLSHFLSTKTAWMTIPLGANEGYQLSYIEGIGTICGLLCIWFASLEKPINFLFGILNITLFSIIFFQINLYANLLLQIFFLAANVYGWYAWTRKTSDNEAVLKIRWLSPQKNMLLIGICVISILILTAYIDPIFAYLVKITVHALNQMGLNVAMPVLEPDAFPFWDSTMMVLSIAAQVLMTRKCVENWILWVIINVISVVIFAIQGVYAMSLEYLILLFIAINGTRLWIKSANQHANINDKNSAA